MNGLDFDFAVLLTVLTVVTGVVWALERWWLGPRRREKLVAGAPDVPNSVVEFCTSFFPVILLVLLLRSFLVEPFRIPSGSMIPTLLVGDFILVNKFAYGLRDPVLHQELWAIGKPARGDVAVFRYPLDPSKDFIKRVIGLPGDRIAYRAKQLYVNEKPVPLEADGVYTAATGAVGVMYRYLEGLTESPHLLAVNPAAPARDFEFVVPAGEYFMMGDNRDGSDDSRRWGTVPEDLLVGRAFFIWMSWDAERMMPAWGRIGSKIH